MSIHVSIGYREGFADKGKPYVEVIDKKFETANQALAWWVKTGFNDGDGSVEEVLKAARTEYVGTEHEIMTPSSTKRRHGHAGYTKMWCCIEGQEGKDTFDDRFRDLYVEEIIDMGEGDYQLNGKDTDGRRVWQSIHLKGNVVMRASELKGMPPS